MIIIFRFHLMIVNGKISRKISLTQLKNRIKLNFNWPRHNDEIKYYGWLLLKRIVMVSDRSNEGIHCRRVSISFVPKINIPAATSFHDPSDGKIHLGVNLETLKFAQTVQRDKISIFAKRLLTFFFFRDNFLPREIDTIISNSIYDIYWRICVYSRRIISKFHFKPEQSAKILLIINRKKRGLKYNKQIANSNSLKWSRK